MENKKVMQPIANRNKSARQMDMEHEQREAAGGREYSDATMKRDGMKKAAGRKMKR